MRYIVLSDIHANLEALDAVLADSLDVSRDRMLVLGDLVGYGADPNAVVERVRAMPGAAVIRGNHDKVAVGLERSDSFNHHARAAIEWTTRTLTPDNRAFLTALPAGPVAIDDLVEICHGTPFDEDVYVFQEMDALRSLRAAARRLCLYGHTHVATAFRLAAGTARPREPTHERQFEVNVAGADSWLVNCGSVGQPRDGDWRAAYGVVDTGTQTVAVRRVAYDVSAAQAKIMAAGLPQALANRLSVGR